MNSSVAKHYGCKCARGGDTRYKRLEGRLSNKLLSSPSRTRMKRRANISPYMKDIAEQIHRGRAKAFGRARSENHFVQR